MSSLNNYIDQMVELPLRRFKGVYILTLGNECTYVGVSEDVAFRLSQHRKNGRIEWDKVFFIEEHDYKKAIIIESELIENYLPKYNKSKGMYRERIDWLKAIHGEDYVISDDNIKVKECWLD